MPENSHIAKRHYNFEGKRSYLVRSQATKRLKIIPGILDITMILLKVKISIYNNKSFFYKIYFISTNYLVIIFRVIQFYTARR